VTRLVLPVLMLALAGCSLFEGDDQKDAAEPMLDRGPNPFVFSTQPLEAYARVDRMGAPVVATILLPTSEKDRFNQDDPINDGDYSEFVVPTLERLHFELDDDLVALALTPCAVDDCVRQAVPMVVPDVLHLKLADPDGFPNGRRIEDSVVDRILAIALLDSSTPGACGGTPCTVDSLVAIPVNPPANELTFLPDFPYLAPPHP
jgi:hypothetical protein